MATKKELSEAARSIGRKGGEATLKKMGVEHFKKMSQKRWKDKKTK